MLIVNVGLILSDIHFYFGFVAYMLARAPTFHRQRSRSKFTQRNAENVFEVICGPLREFLCGPLRLKAYYTTKFDLGSNYSFLKDSTGLANAALIA